MFSATQNLHVGSQEAPLLDVIKDSLDQANADNLLRLAPSHESDVDLLLLFDWVLEYHGQDFLEGSSKWGGLRLLQNPLH